MLLHARVHRLGARHRQLHARCHRLSFSLKPTTRQRHSLHISRRHTGAVMTIDPKRQLWSSDVGIRFAPVTRSRQPLYPRLDLARFFVTAGTDGGDAVPARSSGSGNSEEVSSAEGPSDGTEDQSFVINLPLREDAAIPPTDPSILSAPEETSDPKVILPPSTSLEYQICPEKFDNARKSSPGSPASFWSYNMYSKGEPDTGTTRNVKVHYCKTKHTMEEVCKRYFLNCDVLGFDMEWKIGARVGGSPRDNVSLIQVASEAHVGLFHVAVFPKDDFVAPTFRQIMEDSKVSKAGVNIKGDCTRLRTYLGVDTRGIFELSHLYKVVKYSREKTPGRVDKRVVSMATQAEEFLRLPLYKGDSVRTSNWALNLNSQQIAYAASDAYAGFQLYHVLEKERQSLDPTPPRPYHAELNKPLEPVIPVDEEFSDDEIVSIENPVNDLSAETLVQQSAEAQKPAPRTPKTPKVAFSYKGPRNSPSTPVAIWDDERVIAAELKMQNYRAAKMNVKGGTVRTRPSALRAYYVWHCNKDMKPGDIAKLLRDPPLLTHTVTGYILDAITSEKLPFDKERMTTELLSLLQPSSLTLGRYQPLIQECGYSAASPASPSPTV